MRKLYFAALLLVVFSACLSAQTKTESTSALHKNAVLSDYGKLPLSFEANRGQTDERVKFLSRGSGYSLFLTKNEAVIALKRAGSSRAAAKKAVGNPEMVREGNESAKGATLRMQLLGANFKSEAVGGEELPGKANYFIGNDPSKWRTNVPTYAKVKYENVYPGVDLVYYGNQGQLEYDFVVAPGADPNRIQLKFRGAGRLRVNENGDLLLGTAGDEVRFEKPVVYQRANGERRAVEGSYVMAAANTIRFRISDYDRSRELVIDPVLAYSTYLGGSGADGGSGIAVDASGSAYVTGGTGSADFPTANALQLTLDGRGDAFVTKINASGSALVYSTYLGGSGSDAGSGIALDASGNAYVTGFTSSPDFPTANAVQPALAGLEDAFVTKINASGSALVYSTYLGGKGGDSGSGIAVDVSGNSYITGTTVSTDFPTVNPLQAAMVCGLGCAFVTKVNPSGSALIYSTYLGGDYAFGNGIAADAFGNAYVTGYTVSKNFPTANALQPALSGDEGDEDAFVTKINATGSALIYSTYLGGKGGDRGSGIAVDASGNAYVTGLTESTDFPTANALQRQIAGDVNAFVTKINASGSALVYSTYLGGDYYDMGNGIAVDAIGSAYVTGSTESYAFPKVNALQPLSGMVNSFVTKINATGSALVYSTFLGGYLSDVSNGIAVDSYGNAYITGLATSPNFPMAHAFQPTLAGDNSAFVTKITGDQMTLVTTGSIVPAPNALGWNNRAVTVDLRAVESSSGPGVKQITYSTSGAESIGPTVVPGDTASLTIRVAGITDVRFFASDSAGNVAVTKGLTVKLDETAPRLAFSVVAQSPRVVTITAQDSASGVRDVTYSLDGVNYVPYAVPIHINSANAITVYAVAEDVAGNHASASVELPKILVGDLDANGSVGCDDLAVVKAAFGKKVGQPGYDPRADINGDGIVNVLDLSMVARLLPAGTTCK